VNASAKDGAGKFFSHSNLHDMSALAPWRRVSGYNGAVSKEDDVDSQTVFERDGEYASREVAGEMILVPIRSGSGDVDSIFTLNEVGAVVWRELGQRRTVQQILESVTSEFETTPEQAEADVLEFLQALEERSLIRRAGSG
jgi:hypothetical protein